MSINENEDRLLSQAIQGSRDAFGDLYEFYLDEVYRYVFYRVNKQAEAEDLTEQVFLKVWQNLPGFQRKVPFKSWLFRITRNTVIDYYRTSKNQSELHEEMGERDFREQPEDSLSTRETAERLLRALSKLSQLQQDVIILRFVNGYTQSETAEILDRDIGTIRVLQHRALRTMRAFLIAEDIVNG